MFLVFWTITCKLFKTTLKYICVFFNFFILPENSEFVSLISKIILPFGFIGPFAIQIIIFQFFFDPTMIKRSCKLHNQNNHFQGSAFYNYILKS